MKILLLNPPYRSGFIRTARSTWMPISNSNWYPIYLGYTAGALEQHGHTVKLIDACVVPGRTRESVVNEAGAFKPGLSVLYISSRTLANDLEVAAAIKAATGAPVVFVGPWCFGLAREILQAGPTVDAVVRHEIEPPVVDLADGQPLEQVLGITWQRDGTITENPNRPFMTPQELDRLPFVTDIYRRHLNINAYREGSLHYPYVDLFAGRGCFWGLCTFCIWPQTISRDGGYRMRSLDNVLEEFRFIQRELPHVKDIFFQDDALLPEFARAFSEAVLKTRMAISWSGYARPNFDRETLVLMKRAGCHCLHVGYESGSMQILKTIRKGVNPDTMVRFTRDAKRAGIQIHGDFLLGSPGETTETLQETVAFAKSLNLAVYQFLICDPYAGTVVDDQFKHQAAHAGNGNGNGTNGNGGLSHEQLVGWKIRAYQSMYLRPRALYNVLSQCRSFSELQTFLWSGWNLARNVLMKTYE